MSLCYRFYEIVFGQALSIVKFQTTEEAPLEPRSINRLKAISQQPARLTLVERLRQTFIAKADTAKGAIADAGIVNNQGASSAPSSSSLANCLKPAAALSDSGSGSARRTTGGLVLGVDSLAAIAQVKEKETAARRARVTSTRLTALETYLEHGAN